MEPEVARGEVENEHATAGLLMVLQRVAEDVDQCEIGEMEIV